MKRSAIKLALFTLTNVVVASAHADDLKLIDELPIEQRVAAHQQVLKFLSENPEFAEVTKNIAVDGKGNVYVLDENNVVKSRAGQPSCYSSTMGRQ